jgi:hypothetical protein
MRWLLVPLMVAVVALSGAGAAWASSQVAPEQVSPGQVAPDQVAPPSALVLVERLTTDEALAATGPGRPEVAGFVSTLPVHQPLASRVLSLAAGRRVDAMDALEANPAAASGMPDSGTVERIRADNPSARFGRLPSTRVLAYPGLEAAGLFALGPSGTAPAPGPLGPGDRPIPLRPGQLLVLAVPDAAALADLTGRLQSAEGAGPVMVIGLRAAPGRANSAPLLVLRQPGARGLVTSGSTRRLGLAALEDVRPTLGVGPSEGDDGTVIRLAADPDPAAAVTRIDRRVAALVAARTWAIPLLCLAAVLALFALVATWRARGSPGRSASAARVLLALTLALPSGYLLASMAEPVAAQAWRAFDPGALRDPGAVVPWAAAWVTSGIAVAAALAAVALRLDRPGTAGPPTPVAAVPDQPTPGRARPFTTDLPRTATAATPRPRGRVPAPALLGAVLIGLVVGDLVLGGHGLSQPLVGGSAWDGERFYGLGNGYFAFALASVMLVAGFAPLSAVATAALLAGLGVADGLPRLGADVGGALTSMLTAAAALVVLAPGRPRVRRVVLLAGLAVAAAVAVALGAGLGGPASHAGHFAERLRHGPADAAGVVVDQLARNLRLLANSPFAWAGPLQVLLAGLIALRPPPPLRQLPDWIRRVLGLGALGSLLLILLNDTGVTATSASGLFLLAIPAWAWLDQRRPPSPPAPQPRTRPAEVRH